ncbi:hypothetical protein AABB24_001550 [Solanum stoloniferum]|uniref:SWIM-type domain-containing protein n=2 Tax=Solanum stoloniferum TaxID=62892 RepID=A0ABD2VM01_9SOLN
MVFENVKKFREALSKYAIERGCQLDKIHNDQRRVKVKCKANGCPWILYASKDFKSSDFIIKTYNPRHKCYRTNTNTMCNSKFLAKYYKSRIVSQPCKKGWEIQDLVRTDMGLYVGKFVCLKARKMVLKKIMGDHVAEFSRIYDYRDMFLESNPESTCVVKVTNCDDGKKLFHSFYICFSALKKGFIEGCRKCIGLDGCFLKGISKGQLLVAIVKDGNNQMFPIAWAVVGTESRETWTWFLRILKSDLDINDEGERLTIISDMQKGLYLAVQELLPKCEHRMCARHILANWSKNWKGVEERKRFWACARSTFEAELRKNLDKLAQLGKDISNDLVNFNPNRWSKAQFRTSLKCDSVDNNMAESFNAWVLGARHKTIISMLEEIRKKVMNRFTKVITFVNSWTHDISPMAMLVLNTNVKKSMRVEISWNGDIGYEVKDSPYIHVVNLIQGTCTCRSWGLKGIPCAHAIAAIHHDEANLLESVCKWYKKETYLKAYKHFLQPVTNMKMWPKTLNPKVEPPPVRKMPGRPGKKRKKELGEVPSSGKLPKRGKTMSCSACKSKGHNIRTCPNKPPATSQGIATSQASASSKRSGKQKSHPTQAVQQSQSSEPSQAIVQSDNGNRKGANNAFKRPKVVGHGVFVSKDGFICAEQGRSISKVIKSGAQEKLISSAIVTGDLGYVPSKGLK